MLQNEELYNFYIISNSICMIKSVDGACDTCEDRGGLFIQAFGVGT